MDGQMSLFDFLKPEVVSLEDLEEEEMIRRLERATGLQFVKKVFDDGWYIYEAKKGKAKFTANYSRYSIDNHAKYISVGYMVGTSGGGSPCDSMDEAIKYFHGKILWAKAEEQRQKEVKKRREG